jgi:nitrogen fixation/metabolism regulation signal transduction histidine kinase
MILLIFLATILIIGITIYQYNKQTIDYNVSRFGRKEETLKKEIDIQLYKRSNLSVTTNNLKTIFHDAIYEIAYIHNLEISMYDLSGVMLKTSVPFGLKDSIPPNLSTLKVSELKLSKDSRVFEITENNKIKIETSYTYILDAISNKIGILKLEFNQDNTTQEYELQVFLTRLILVYLFMFLIAIMLAYFLSSYITRSIKSITDKMKRTRLNERYEKIVLSSASAEIGILVEGYNNMIDELEESAVKLATSEREQAWREMAKQVAHEIKNPLTPMRLSVQSFERRFDINDPNVKVKLKEYSDTFINQIDVMSSIAEAFSDFAKMPKQRKEKIDIIGVVKMALDIFSEDYVEYLPEKEEVFANLDKTQLIRIVTNLVKNATQAVEGLKNPKIVVKVFLKNKKIFIEVSDNGKGIKQEVEHLIFEPKFTTKTSGMGLGLPMIKNIIEAYDGSIDFTSKEQEGTTFTVILPNKLNP